MTAGDIMLWTLVAGYLAMAVAAVAFFAREVARVVTSASTTVRTESAEVQTAHVPSPPFKRNGPRIEYAIKLDDVVRFEHPSLSGTWRVVGLRQLHANVVAVEVEEELTHA